MTEGGVYGRIALRRVCILRDVYQLNQTVTATFLKTPIEPALLAGFWAFCARNDLSPSVSLRLVVSHVLTRAGYDAEDYDPGSERRNDYQQWARRRREVIDLNGVHPVLIARVTPGLKAAFQRYASARNQAVPAALKAIVKQVVASAQIEVGELTPPKAPELRSERVTVRFSKSEAAAVAPMAEAFGGIREWIVGIVRARIAPNVPQFAMREVQALYESNRELWAIGRNINQIAHAVNLDMKQAGRLQGSAALVRELESVKVDIDAHTERVMALCNESLNRWSDE